jgi:hypothetical protein
MEKITSKSNTLPLFTRRGFFCSFIVLNTFDTYLGDDCVVFYCTVSFPALGAANRPVSFLNCFREVIFEEYGRFIAYMAHKKRKHLAKIKSNEEESQENNHFLSDRVVPFRTFGIQ